MTAGVVRVDHFEGLEKAVICFRGEVTCDLGGQDVEVWVSGCKLLHRLCIGFKSNCRMTGRWGVVDGGVQPGGRWNGEVPVAEEGALFGERDRLVGEMWSLAMARC